MRIFMTDSWKISKKPGTHRRDLLVVDAVLAALPGTEMNRNVPPAQIPLSFQRNRERDVLKIDIRW